MWEPDVVRGKKSVCKVVLVKARWELQRRSLGGFCQLDLGEGREKLGKSKVPEVLKHQDKQEKKLSLTD